MLSFPVKGQHEMRVLPGRLAGMEGFDRLPNWQREAISIAEDMCRFFDMSPVKKYSNVALERHFTRIAKGIKTVKGRTQQLKALELIIKTASKIPEVPSKHIFVNECAGEIIHIQNILSVVGKKGRPSLPEPLERWILAVIEESKNNPGLTMEFFNFIHHDGFFWKWYHWRYGDQKIPFYFPELASLADNPTNFKHHLKDNILSAEARRLKKLNDPVKEKRAKLNRVNLVRWTREALFERLATAKIQ